MRNATTRSAAAVLLLALSGCAAVIGSAASRLAGNLSTAIGSQTDVQTVREGAPAYLLLLDGLIEGDPRNPTLLLSGARLYGAYAAAFVQDEDRARRLSERAREYGLRALCIRQEVLCDAVDRPFDEFSALLRRVKSSDVDVLYGFGAAWAGWVQTRPDDWSALAHLPRIEALMQRVVELDEAHDGGGAHTYLAVLLSLRPASLGGKPELARSHFERAIAISEGRDLMAKVLYARQYARLVFDRPLHDKLLREVLAADPDAHELTLRNTLAQEQARGLLEDANDYF